MPDHDDEPPPSGSDPLTAAEEFRELFRYGRGGEVRVYSLKVMTVGVELWRVTERPGQPSAPLKEADLASTDEALQLLDDVVRSLTAGGWREV